MEEHVARRRRRPEEAQEEILNAAEQLLLSEGPDAVRLKRVAERVGLSHPGVLHHFGTVEQLLEALSQRTSRKVRQDLLDVLQAGPGGGGRDAAEAVRNALARLAEPKRGRLLAWLVASGRDPFPPVSEQGLREVTRGVQVAGGLEEEDLSFVVELAVLASLGDALFGNEVRRRLGTTPSEEGAQRFRERLVRLLAEQVRGL